MRFTVTPLGASGGATPDQIARRVVNYLQPERREQPSLSPPAADAGGDPSRYYTHGQDAPGRWIGVGADEARLRGVVDPEDFARVLAGRDPRTGRRLIAARGSAGRRPSLAVGTETRWGSRGEPLYDPRDAAAALGLSHEDGQRLIEAGEHRAMRNLFAGLLGGPTANDEDPGDRLVPIIDRDSSRWIPDYEVSRCEQARTDGPNPEAILAAGDPDDVLSMSEAARLAGVTPRYLRSVARRYEDHHQEIDAIVAAGRQPRRAYLVAHRGTNGRWRVRRSDLVAFLERRRQPAVRVGYDLTLTTEKSLGVLALLGDDTTRAAVLGAIRAGNDTGLTHLESEVISARSRGQPVGVRGWTVAAFEHHTSRALDPFPHHHNVIANAVVDEHGGRRALDARGLYWHAGEASALATAEMRHRLTTALGVRWRRVHHGGWEIDGIPDAVLREFSQRRVDIEEAVRELETAIGRGTSIDELQSVVLGTRQPKTGGKAEELRERWWHRARRHGFTSRRLAATTRRANSVELPPREELFARLVAPDGLCAESSIFTRGDVLAALVDLPLDDGTGGVQPPIVSPAELEALADAFLASEHVVELIPTSARLGLVPSRLRRQGLFTTREMLHIQQRILEVYEAGLERDFARVDPQLAFEAADRQGLSDEQRRLAVEFCTSGHQIHTGVGRAGAGKTTTMRTAAVAWRTAGYQVLGTAVKGEAARLLGQEAGIPSETLAWYLARDDPESSPLDARTVLIVDEASTISDRDLAKLLHLAAATGTTVRLVGDPAQHGAVGAGGMFRVLCERFPEHTPELTRSHRLQHPGDAAAATALRDGRIDEALTHLAAAEHLHLVDDDLDLYVDLLTRWWHSYQAGTPHPMVDRRNRTRRQLNRLAHRLLQTSGNIGSDELTASGQRAFSVGDHVVARATNRQLHVKGDRHAYLRNGATGTVTALHRSRSREGDQLVVAFDGIGTIAIPRSFFDQHPHRSGRVDVGLDHAYALTSYAVQGTTYGISASRIDEHTGRAEAYVDITRGRNANHLYLTRGLDPLDGETLPKAPPPPLDDSVRGRLEASGPERAAIELDPHAHRRDTAGDDLHKLHRQRDRIPAADSDRLELRRREEARARHVARTAEQRLPRSILETLPDQPQLPYLRRQRRDTLAAIATYRERWQPGPSTGRWGWALGPHPDDPNQERESQEAINRIVDLTIATTAEALRVHGWEHLPPWALPHLQRLAAHGTCQPDPARLANLYRRVATYRQRVTLHDPPESHESAAADDHPVLGPRPSDPALVAMHRALDHELRRTSTGISTTAALPRI